MLDGCLVFPSQPLQICKTGHVLSTTQESVSITPYLFSDRLSKKIKSYSAIHLDQFLNGFATLMDTTDSLIGILSSVKQVKNGSDSLASNDTAIGSTFDIDE
ncbi:hypothetical protein BDEG_23629 [Batrachochytrium dendrobatidis JEL423]|uniref:Uncharacterized protein n=1 Tax=Batrachochytrium dendrobatidis (strain JEL423) TaxID=403673 RepID=A0A177WJH3_BATDL|nr:hypothetical protein BDEG_23629 [Batrachochytrium dendrobatidis JEL423]